MSDGEHTLYERLAELHNPVGTFDNGSCLSGHLNWWEQRNSCSYRWQGVAKANQEPGKSIYNSHSNKLRRLNGIGHGWVATKTLALGRGGSVVEGFETRVINKTKKDGTVKSTEKQRVTTKAFTNGFSPYANQVHHVLPVAVLRSSIEEVSEPAPSIEDMVGGGLLQEKYNINYKENAIILPVKWADACEIGLPTHLGSHPTYSAKVQSATMKAMKPYQKIAEQVAEEKPHDKPEPADLKDALVDISKKMYAALIGLRPTILGKCKATQVTLNEIPKSVYKALGV